MIYVTACMIIFVTKNAHLKFEHETQFKGFCYDQALWMSIREAMLDYYLYVSIRNTIIKRTYCYR